MINPLVVDDEGWLRGPRVLHIPTPLIYGQLASGEPLGVMFHYTGGPGTLGYALALARSISKEHVRALKAQKKPIRSASWHVLIAKNGEIIQSASFLCGTWHCVGGAIKEGDRVYTANRSLIGIELENSGWLRKHTDGEFYRWSPSWSGLGDHRYRVPRNRVKAAGSRYWDEFTQEQVDAAKALMIALTERYPMKAQHLRYEHRQFAQKDDPGDLWVMEHLPSVLEGLR
jgi:N-acetyl-anhydromuramyl-L-alanine amidase AmpD